MVTTKIENPTGTVKTPLLCEDCSAGCIGHGLYVLNHCAGPGCECRKHWPRSLRKLTERWTELRSRAEIVEGTTILVTALRVAAEQFDCAAQASREVPRTREQFLLQAAQCRVIAEAIEP